MWLWAIGPGAGEAEVRALWQAYLRRFDLEHTFRFLKQQLGWTRPLLRDPAAADRWTWLLIAAYAQLYLARDLAAVVRLPWQPRRPAAGDDPRPGPRRIPPRPRNRRHPRQRRRNPPAPAPDAPKARRTSTRHPATALGKTTPNNPSSQEPQEKDKTDRLNGKY